MSSSTSSSNVVLQYPGYREMKQLRRSWVSLPWVVKRSKSGSPARPPSDVYHKLNHTVQMSSSSSSNVLQYPGYLRWSSWSVPSLGREGEWIRLSCFIRRMLDSREELPAGESKNTGNPGEEEIIKKLKWERRGLNSTQNSARQKNGPNIEIL